MSIRLQFTAILLIFSSTLFAQKKTYLEGTIVNNQGDSVKAFLRAANWLVNSPTISYKTNPEGEVIQATPSDLKAYVVEGKGTFVSAELAIDQSSDKTERLTGSSEPVMKTQHVFLRQIITGDVQLYVFRRPNFKRYIVYTDERGYEQLIYKRYLNGGYKVLYNRNFRSQLLTNYGCGADRESVQMVKYDEKSLGKYLMSYAACNSLSAEKLDKANHKPKVKYFASFGAGLINGSFVHVNNDPDYGSFDGTSIRFDAGLELMTPVENPFSIFINFSSESFSSSGVWRNRRFYNESRTALVTSDQPWNVNVSYGTLGIGIRKYFLIQDNLSFRVSGMLVPSFTLWQNSTIETLPLEGLRNSPNTVELEENTHYVASAGLAYKKFTMSMKYYFGREQLLAIDDFSVRYSSLNISLGLMLN